jgi:EAL domain-containing protein (putative c-di-GMP-specific phosphodiesterase class I)
VGVFSPAPESALMLNAIPGSASWRDPSGIRGVIRHGLGRQAAVILLGVAIAGALSGVGELWIYAAMAAAAAGHFLAKPGLERLGLTITPEIDFRIAVVGWPVALLILGFIAWPGPSDIGEIVAVAGFVMAALVALAESIPIAVLWTVVASSAVVLGDAAAGRFGLEAIVAAAAVGGGTLTGARLQRAIEKFLGARRRLMREVSRVPMSEDPFVTAELLLRPLVQWTPLTSIAITWFREDGRAVILGAAGVGLPAVIGAGTELPEGRARELQAQAQQGPWISGWTVRQDDDGYSLSVAAAGIKAAVYAPLVFEGRVIGTIGAGLTDRGDDRSAMAEYVPILVEFADAAAVALGPSLAKRDQDFTSQRAVDEILEGRLFHPVFQAVRRLSDGRIVGYEALTRFDSTLTTPEVFSQARTTGRMRDLELATLQAAVDAATALPPDCWLSVNSSPNLLVEPDTLAEILAPVQQEVVIELSEHDQIDDYAPIAAAFARLGPGRRLAIDDAGSGFASLRHILEVRPHFVKLDIGLVQGLAADMARTALVAGFVRFATDAGFELIAEGIETDADRRALRRLGVELGQGFLLGRPLPVRDVIAAHPSQRRGRSRRDRSAGATIGTRAPQPG